MDNTPEGENKHAHRAQLHHELHIEPLSPPDPSEESSSDVPTEPTPLAPPSESTPLIPGHTPPAPAPTTPDPAFAPSPPPSPAFTPAPPQPPVTPAPAGVPPAAPSNTQAPGMIGDSYHPGMLILQWLTYAFWGWLVLVLSWLTFWTFQRIIGGSDFTTFNDYLIAALIVLLPAAFFCDLAYTKSEPDRKTGAASLIMVVHAVIFAIFGVGALLFAAWSIVGIATNSFDRSSQVSYLCTGLLSGGFYAATFMRTLNPAHIQWLPKVYRFSMVGAVLVLGILGALHFSLHHTSDSNGSSSTYNYNSGSSSTSGGTTEKNNFGSNGKLEPSVVGGTQCDIPELPDGSTTGQVALTGGATCDEAEASIQSANGRSGGSYTASGYTCTSTRQGANTQWSDYWNDNFYSYNCTSGSKQTAFNLQTASQASSSPTLTD